MKFGKMQQRKFSATEGSYSTVTERENFDSQITLTDYEAELVISHYGRANIHVGRVSSDPGKSSKPMRLYPDGTNIELNINFPKRGKTELRLYISSGAGFKPDGGEIWFMFSKKGDLWIGSMRENVWRAEFSEFKNDEADPIYQEALDETDVFRIARLKERDIYARDRDVALNRMRLSNFSCEYDPKHILFISRFRMERFVEAHHLIPMALQGEFSVSLDNIHNVFCLCPFCHRAVHHAEKSLARDILNSLSSKRNVLDTFRLSVPDLHKLYAIEEIE